MNEKLVEVKRGGLRVYPVCSSLAVCRDFQDDHLGVFMVFSPREGESEHECNLDPGAEIRIGVVVVEREVSFVEENMEGQAWWRKDVIFRSLVRCI